MSKKIYGSKIKPTIEDMGALDGFYDQTTIDNMGGQIDNSQSSTVRHTSIPTPFARIDLALTAFRHCTNNIDGNTPYHQIVSDCLDIGEIFFNIDYFDPNVIKIVRWNKNDNVQRLVNAGNRRHILYGETLKLFLDQDSAAYNFDRMDNLFFITYNNKVIGGTSPITLFATSGNNLDITTDIQVNGRKLFKRRNNDTTGIVPLYKRDKEYQRYLYSLVASDTILSNSMAQLREYINNNKIKAQNTNIWFNNAIISERVAFNKSYADIRSVDGQVVEVLGQNIKKINDYLSPNMVFFDYPINTENFFVGNGVLPKEVFFLPPLSEKFLQRYPIQMLINTIDPTENNRVSPWIKLEQNTIETTQRKVKATLSVPIDGQLNPIIHERLYSESIPSTCFDSDGKAIKGNFSVSIFPPLKLPLSNNNMYKIMLSDMSKDTQCSITFHTQIVNQGNISVQPLNNTVSPQTRSTGSNDQTHVSKFYDISGNSFDYIKFNNNREYEFILIPKWQQQEGAGQFTFAVDFGTTNTHIEVQSRGESVPFTIPKTKIQTASLHDIVSEKSKEYEYAVIHEFVPSIIENNEFKFPFRTVLSYLYGMDETHDYFNILCNCNIPFGYEQYEEMPNVQTKKELKWGHTDKKVVPSFFGQLAYMMRNMVLLNGGNLAQTNLICFYPTSMNVNDKNAFQETWQREWARYFMLDGNNNINTRIKNISEAIAPYYFYSTQGGIGKNPAITIDIGGGTTDVVIFDISGEGLPVPKIQTSFRFAGNSALGGELSQSDNLILKKYLKEIEDNIKDEKKSPNATPTHKERIDSLIENLSKRKKEGASVHLLTFLLSLEEQKVSYWDTGEYKTNNKLLSSQMTFLPDKLKNDNTAKITLLLFYGAIIYHIGRILKIEEKIPMPENFLFSGTASKLLNILGQQSLAQFTKYMLNKVYGTNVATDINIKISDIPKEITCKGGLLAPNNVNDLAQHIKPVILLGNNENSYVDAAMKYKDLNKDDRGINTDQFIIELQDFLGIVLNTTQKEFSYSKQFNITDDEINKVNQKINDILVNSAKIQNSYKTAAGGDKFNGVIEESLFFVGVKTLIEELHKKLG